MRRQGLQSLSLIRSIVTKEDCSHEEYTANGAAERQGTQGGAERGRGFRRAIRKSICTSNAIESLNTKLKRETHKRILANSEDNATIITVNVFRSYDKSAGMRSRKGLMEVSREERRRMGFEI